MHNTKPTIEFLDPTSCKAFWFAAAELNFSIAAQKAGMTQPGISKHITKLEEQLRTSLFVRTSRKVALTESGQILKKYIDSLWADYDRLQSLISIENYELAGEVKYAMPESCLMSPHFGMLLQSREKKFSKIKLSVTIAHNSAVEKLILDGQVDFGFLTTKSSKANSIKFCLEEYVLVGSKPFPVKTLKDILKLNFVNHPDLPHYFNHWKSVFFTKEQVHFNDLNIVNSMNDMRGVVTMLCYGSENDVTILPRHCILKELESKKLKVFNPSLEQVQNQIYMASLNKSQTTRVKKIQDEFFQMLISK